MEEFKNTPLVSVICLCYQHEKYVKKALESVIFQSYPNIELLIIDDASTDDSVKVIQSFINELTLYQDTFQDPLQAKARANMRIEFWINTDNKGNCTAFNSVLKEAKGKYIIDLAADDVLLDDRIQAQVDIFEELSPEYAVVFSNALHIDSEDKVLYPHYPIDSAEKSKITIPSGDVYIPILKKYFISTPTMLIKKSVLIELGGYDESLSYEDFDFWVRSSRKYLYHYQDEITTLKRIIPASHSSAFYKQKHNPHLISTLKVCKKARLLNQTPEEDEALIRCTKYHFRQCFFTQNHNLLSEYYQLLKEMNGVDRQVRIIHVLSKYKVNLSYLYKLYRKMILRLRHQNKSYS